MSHHTGTVPLCSTSGSTVATLRTSTERSCSLGSQDFEHDPTDLGEEEPDGATVVPLGDLHVGARDAALAAPRVRTLEIAGADGDAPHLGLVALEELVLAALGVAGDVPADRLRPAAERHDALHGERAVGGARRPSPLGGRLVAVERTEWPARRELDDLLQEPVD